MADLTLEQFDAVKIAEEQFRRSIAGSFTDFVKLSDTVTVTFSVVPVDIVKLVHAPLRAEYNDLRTDRILIKDLPLYKDVEFTQSDTVKLYEKINIYFEKIYKDVVRLVETKNKELFKTTKDSIKAIEPVSRIDIHGTENERVIIKETVAAPFKWKTPFERVKLKETISLTVIYLRTKNETAKITDAYSRVLDPRFGFDSVKMSDSLVVTKTFSRADQVILKELRSLQAIYSKSLFDSIKAGDPNTYVDIHGTSTETVKLSEKILLSKSNSFSDLIKLKDRSIRIECTIEEDEKISIKDLPLYIDFEFFENERVKLKETVSLLAIYNKNLIEKIKLIETKTFFKIIPPVTERVKIKEEQFRKSVVGLSSELIRLSEKITINGEFARILNEKIKFTETKINLSVYSRKFFDAIKVLDAANKEKAVFGFEKIRLAETKTKLSTYNRLVLNKTSLNDIFTKSCSYSRVFNDKISLKDISLRSCSYFRNSINNILLLENFSKSCNYSRIPTDKISLLESFVFSKFRLNEDRILLIDTNFLHKTNLTKDVVKLKENVKLFFLVNRLFTEKISLTERRVNYVSSHRIFVEDININADVVFKGLHHLKSDRVQLIENKVRSFQKVYKKLSGTIKEVNMIYKVTLIDKSNKSTINDITGKVVKPSVKTLIKEKI